MHMAQSLNAQKGLPPALSSGTSPDQTCLRSSTTTTSKHHFLSSRHKIAINKEKTLSQSDTCPLTGS